MTEDHHMVQTTATRKNGGDYLNRDLPSEMMTEIGKYLDLNNRLKLRLLLVRLRQDNVIEMLQAGIAESSLRVPELNFDIERWIGGHPKLLTFMASQLRRLVMNCTDAHDIGISDRHGEMVSAYWWERIVKSTTNLVELDICTGYRSYPATFDDERQGCKVMDHFLRHGHYCQLRKLEFRRSKHTGPTVVDSHVLKGFSTAHAKTLRHVSMSDILPPTGSVMNMSDVLLAYKSLLSASMPAIQILKVSLSRLDKHDDEKCYCVGNGYCQWYRFPICNLLARNFDELANYFEMELKDGSWDSGEIVMRGCQA